MNYISTRGGMAPLPFSDILLEGLAPVSYTHLDVYKRQEQVSRRLAKAETWLQQRPTDPDLLTALGMLCLNGQL